ncbi:LysR substrate-binding domain-containing protein [Vibrio sp. SCSIO 43136]|uniref:LysR substrate-binding domain-containing protein n=1 Tax=Vibrio sp. SCSIO 43136 TaxID=2819101 RepID=UPI0020755743|nr:LysR substrate-binding domain-containing protein [Vibrio sp. SCSIO 43136]USD64743.1 LysR family transcriptional regulator [Vibrio sp. SCSIO 43136]
MKERLPPLQALYYFHLAAQTGSFKQAASELFVSPAAISQQIRQLEEWLKCELFVRQHRKVVLTKEGEVLYQSTQKGFVEIQNGVRLLNQDPDPQRLSISTLPSFAQHWLVPRLQSFRQQYPDISMLIEPKNSLVDFHDSSVDVCVRYGTGDYDGLESVWLMDEILYPACHPLYKEKHGIDGLEDLHRVDLIEDFWPDMNWDIWLDAAGVPPAAATLKYAGAHFVLEGALAVQGVALVRHSLAHRYIQEGKLEIIGNLANHSKYSYFLCAPEGYLKRDKLIKFRCWLEDEIKLFEQSPTKPLDVFKV